MLQAASANRFGERSTLTGAGCTPLTPRVVRTEYRGLNSHSSGRADQQRLKPIPMVGGPRAWKPEAMKTKYSCKIAVHHHDAVNSQGVPYSSSGQNCELHIPVEWRNGLSVYVDNDDTHFYIHPLPIEGFTPRDPVEGTGRITSNLKGDHYHFPFAGSQTVILEWNSAARCWSIDLFSLKKNGKQQTEVPRAPKNTRRQRRRRRDRQEQFVFRGVLEKKRVRK